MRSERIASVPQSRRWITFGVMLGLVAALLVVFPPVRVHRIQPPGSISAGGNGIANALSPEAAAVRLWDERLRPAALAAMNAQTVVAALRVDPAAARSKFGTSPVMGGSTYFFISGSGRVVSKGNDEIAIVLDTVNPGSDRPDLVIKTGPLFGNALRDGSGLFKSEDYTNSSDYNALSTALNKLFRTRVLPTLKQQAEVGGHIQFAGVGEWSAGTANALPLQLVPVVGEVR